jgi:hypothetical protein
MLRKLKSAAMVAGFIGICASAFASPCRADGIGGVNFAVWRNRPVEADAPPEVSAESDAPLRQDERKENGCPASSGLSPRRWVCLTLPEASETDSRLIDLEARLVAALARKPHALGLSISCSVGAAVSSTGDAGFVLPACGIYYGFAWRLGK